MVADVTEQVRERIETAARERIPTAVAEHNDPRLSFHLVAREAAAVAGCEADAAVGRAVRIATREIEGAGGRVRVLAPSAADAARALRDAGGAERPAPEG